MQTNCCADAETIIRNTSVAMRLILLRLLVFPLILNRGFLKKYFIHMATVAKIAIVQSEGRRIFARYAESYKLIFPRYLETRQLFLHNKLIPNSPYIYNPNPVIF